MALANVANTDNFQTWLTRTNQLVSAFNTIDYGTSNNWANLVGTSANSSQSSFALSIANATNSWANTVGTSANTFQLDYTNNSTAAANTAAARSANNFAGFMANSVNSFAAATYSSSTNFAASNGWANLVGSSANSFLSNFVVRSSAASNSFANLVGAACNTRIAASGLANSSITLNGSFKALSDISTDQTFIARRAVISNGSILSAETGFKNRIINGDFNVWQRGTTFTPSSFTTATAYTADRWYCFRGARPPNTITVSQSSVSFNGTNRKAIRVQRVPGDTFTGGTYYIAVAQQIESVNCVDLAGKTVAVSLLARVGSNFSSDFLVIGLYTGTGVDESALTLEGFTGDFTALSQPTQASFLVGSFVRLTYLAQIPNNISEMRFTVSYSPTGTAGNNDWFEILDVQLEQNSFNATNFERVDYATQLSRCQRYYEESLGLYDANRTTGSHYTRATISGYYHQITMPFVVTKRAVPIITPFAHSTGTAGKVRNISRNLDVDAFAELVGLNNFTLTIGNPNTGNPGPVVDSVYDSDGFQYSWIANAEI